MSQCDPDGRNSAFPLPIEAEDLSVMVVYESNDDRIGPLRIRVQIDPYTRLIVGFRILPIGSANGEPCSE